MRSNDILYSRGANDECITLDYAVVPIIKYVPKDAVVWCPFDKENSEFVKQLTVAGNKVIATHIDNGQDFYDYEPDEYWDCIISNPPFTNKRLIFERALSFNKPFALIMSNTWLNDSAPKQLFKDKDLQLLMFDKRMKFMNNGVIDNRITFSSSYFCYKFLPKQIIMETLDESLTDYQIIIDDNTGFVFGSIEKCAEYLETSVEHVKNILKGNVHSKKFNIRYFRIGSEKIGYTIF